MCFFFFNDTATTEIYTLSLHDALPISPLPCHESPVEKSQSGRGGKSTAFGISKRDRKSTRLNSSHGYISYAVFCLKKKKQISTQLDYLKYINASTLFAGSMDHAAYAIF